MIIVALLLETVLFCIKVLFFQLGIEDFFSHTAERAVWSVPQYQVFSLPELIWFFSIFHKATAQKYIVFQESTERCVYGFFFPFLLAGRGKNAKFYTVNISGKK